MKSNKNASQLAELTFNLLEDCHQKEERLAGRYGLTRSEFHCLRLFSIGETVNNKDLAKRCKISPGRLSRIANGLVEKGYVLRTISTDDRRNMHLTLSEKGNHIVGRLNKAYIDIHNEILQNIDAELHDSLISGMTHLLSALRKWMNKP